MEEDNPGKGIFDPGEGTSSGVNSRSRTSLWRDQQKILNAANHDPDAISKAHQTILPTADAAYVAKRISSDPHLGEPLRKYIKKLDKDLERMDDELYRDEDGENVSPIRALGYLLGLCTCHVQNQKSIDIPYGPSMMYYLETRQKRPTPPTSGFPEFLSIIFFEKNL